MDPEIEFGDGAVVDKKFFVWRDRDGRNHDITRMDTDYMFNVVCMIWNNLRPDKPTQQDFNRYSFGKFYEKAYLSKALSEMIKEMVKREDDLSTKQRVTLKFILAVIKIEAAERS